MPWVELLLVGVGGAGGSTLYEDWLEVEILDIVTSLGRESGRLDRLRERADVCASVPV